jgi:tetratricopeptide (TPR) repeat protein
MAFWNRLFKRRSRGDLRPQRLDYLNEALALERQGDFDAALTSYRLALRDDPSDIRVLQNIAIAFSKAEQHDEAIRYYCKALDIDSTLMGAHYGLAFLLIKRGETEAAVTHLKAFLANPPRDAEAQKWIDHAQQTLHTLGYAEEL